MSQWSSHLQPAAGAASIPLPPGAQNVTLFVEPDDNRKPIIDAINGAISSILLEIYELTDIHMDPNVAKTLLDAASKQVKVQILLFKDAYRFFSSPTPNWDDVMLFLSKGLPSLQVQENAAQLGPYGKKHQKFMVIDDSAVFIMTANLSSSALGGNNREYLIRDTDPQDIQALQTLFHADWNGGAVSDSLLSKTPNLVVSPINSLAMLTSLIRSAQTSLYLETEEYNDPTITQALLAAVQKQGVQEVKLILPPVQQASSSSQQATAQKSASALAALQKGGVSVKSNARYYMHAKLIIVDKTIAFVGSQNLGTQSLTGNREVGIVVSNPDAIHRLCNTFGQDWNSVATPTPG
jgi:cardiolipin synthase A/B